MRYAVISDIHSNIQALKAVFMDIENSNIDKIISLGDIIGYGPNPAEVLEKVHKSVHHFVLGNHDAALYNKISTENFSKNSVEILKWTRERIDKKTEHFFQFQPLTFQGENFKCTHSNFFKPEEFGYIENNDDAQKSFDSSHEQLLFVGHSHIPCMFVKRNDGPVHCLKAQDFSMEDDKRYIVNVGSVGASRDNDTRASYYIYDTKNTNVFLRRVPYDIEGFKASLNKKGFPKEASNNFNLDNKQKTLPLRDGVEFSSNKETNASKSNSATCADKKTIVLKKPVSEKTETETIDKVNVKKRIIPIPLKFILLLTILISSFCYMMINLKSNNSQSTKVATYADKKTATYAEKEPASYAEIGQEVLDLTSTNYDENIIPFLFSSNLPNWIITKGDNISMTSETIDNISELKILSEEKNESFHFRYIPIKVKKSMKIAVSVQFKNLDFKGGNLFIKLVQKLDNGTEVVLRKNNPKSINKYKRWLPTRMTQVIEEDGLLSLVVEGQFLGEIKIRKFSLKKKE